MSLEDVKKQLHAWTPEQSRARGTKRWGRYPEPVLDLSVAEMDFPTAEGIMASIRDSVERERFGYPLTEEHTGFSAAAGAWLREGGHPVLDENVFMLAHLAQGIVLSVRHFTAPGAPVIVITPAYGSFFSAIETAEREVIEVPMILDEAGRYTLDIEGISGAIVDRGAGSVLLCSPNNPTGTVFGADALSALADLAVQHGIRVISDEVHAVLCYSEAEHVPFASVSPNAAECAITLTSASKAWNIPGLRCAVIAFTREDDVPVWHSLSGGAKGGISPLGVHATIAAFTTGSVWLAAAREVLEGKRDLLAGELNGLGFGPLMTPPDATYLAWLDLRRFDVPDAAAAFLSDADVLLTGGPAHGESGRGFVRVNFATHDSVLEDFVARTRTLLSTWATVS